MSKNHKKKQKIKEICDFRSLDLLEIPLLVKLLEKVRSRAKSYDVPFSSNTVIKDFCLKMRPEKEDDFYLNNPIYLQNVRKGNSIIEFLSYNIPGSGKEEEKGPETAEIEGGTSREKSCRFIVRKGLMKFFDFRPEILAKKCSDLQLKERILGEIEARLREKLEKWRVLVYKTTKENGTNVQINYVEKLDAWLIASKNTSILARNSADLKLYDDNEFGLVKQLAECWISEIGRVGGTELGLLKAKLKDYTLVGEYVGGDKKTAKIVRYGGEELRFFALVEVRGRETCVPPTETLDFLRKIQLKSVAFEVICEAESFEVLCAALQRTHLEVCESPMSSCGEGCVLYLVLVSPQGVLKVSSLCKMKTLEYRLLRKIREKLRKIQDFSKFPKNLLKSYIREAESLVLESGANVSLDFYVKLAEEFFLQITEFHSKANYKKAVSLFSLFSVKAAENVRMGLKRNIFVERQVLALSGTVEKGMIEEIKGRVEEEGVEFVGKISEIAGKKTEKIVTFVEEIEEIGDFIRSTNDLVKVIRFSERKEGISEKLPVVYIGENPDKELILEAIRTGFQTLSINPAITSKNPMKKPQKSKKSVVIFLPIGIPCMGKSHMIPIFKEFFEEKGYEFHTISSDSTHKELIDEQILRNQGKKNVDFEEIREKTSKKAKNLYIERFSAIMKKISGSKSPLNVLFIDKNHPPNGLDKALGLINAHPAPSLEIRVIALGPSYPAGSQIKNLPFSLGFIEACLRRSLHRIDHETLRGDDLKVFDVILMFVRMFKGFRLNIEHLRGFGIESLWLLPFSESEGVEYSEKERKNLEDCVWNKGDLRYMVEWIGGRTGKEIGPDAMREALTEEWERKGEVSVTEEEKEESDWDSLDGSEEDF